MSVADKIETLRKSHDTCRMMTFSDLATGLVLCASSRERARQEALDTLSDGARDIFDGSGGQRLGALLGDDENGEILASVAVIEPGRARIFVRSPADPYEALCCECDAAAPLAEIEAQCRKELVEIGATH